MTCEFWLMVSLGLHLTLVQRQRSQTSMRVARQIATLLWSHGRAGVLSIRMACLLPATHRVKQSTIQTFFVILKLFTALEAVLPTV